MFSASRRVIPCLHRVQSGRTRFRNGTVLFMKHRPENVPERPDWRGSSVVYLRLLYDGLFQGGYASLSHGMSNSASIKMWRACDVCEDVSMPRIALVEAHTRYTHTTHASHTHCYTCSLSAVSASMWARSSSSTARLNFGHTRWRICQAEKCGLSRKLVKSANVFTPCS